MALTSLVVQLYKPDPVTSIVLKNIPIKVSARILSLLQDPNDEPASELLTRIAAEKAKMEAEKISIAKPKKRKRA